MKFQLDISIVSVVHNDIGFEMSTIAIVRRRGTKSRNTDLERT